MKPNAVFLKLGAIVAIVGLLMFALSQIGQLVAERQMRSHEAQASVEQSLAGPQSLLGPVLTSACVEEWDTSVGDGRDRKTVVERREFRLAATPRQLSIDASATMEPRYRGLFKVNTYATHATLRAQWDPLVALRPQREHAGSRLVCAAPVLMVAVSDARGIRSAHVSVGNDSVSVQAGTQHPGHPKGIHAVLPEPLRDAAAPLVADVTLDLVGTAQLAVAPVAGDTRMQLEANWPHPSFGGRFLPITREVRPDGFTATWQVSSLATTAPVDFLRGTGTIDSFDVAFIDPVNPYSLSDRAIKYGLLFVGLTFVAVGMVEVLWRLRVHPIQYLLVGSALSIFFLLLLSLSEHLRFDVSYAVAAGACVALLAFYARHLLRGWQPGLVFGAGTAALYGALYALLQLEQTALVIGAVLLFAVLAGVMVLTRRVDWYRLLANEPAAAAAKSAP